MPVWGEIFIVVATIALDVQTLVMLSTLMLLRPTILRFAQIAVYFQGKRNPILTSAGRILADSEERIKSIVENASEISHTARAEAENVDRVISDAVDRLRVQIIRTDQMVTT